MFELFKAVLCGVIATGVAGIIAFLWKNRNTLRFLRYIRACKRVWEAGVVTFFYNRKTLQTDAGTIGDFISKANKEVVYVGCWLSSSLTSLDLKEVLIRKAESGVMFKFCVISPNARNMDKYAVFFGEDEQIVKEKIVRTIQVLNTIRMSLDIKYRKNIKIYTHESILTASFWALDYSDKRRALYQIDHKIASIARFHSYGMEFIERGKKSFASDVKEGYFNILSGAKEIKLKDL